MTFGGRAGARLAGIDRLFFVRSNDNECEIKYMFLGSITGIICNYFIIRKKFILAFSALISIVFLCSSAFAQCKTDVECKDDRICVAGECVSPQPPSQSQASAAMSETQSQAVSNIPNTSSPTYYPNTYQSNPYQLQQPQVVYRRPLSRGWAIPGGALGVVFSGVTLGLEIKSEIERENDISMAYGGATLGVMGLWTPLVFAAAKSARNGDPRVRGVVGLRITGWVTYGLAWASGVSLIAMGLAEVTALPGYIAATTAVGVASILCMSIDAFVSGAQAGRAIRQDAAAAIFPALPWALWEYFKEFARYSSSPSPCYIEEGLFFGGRPL